MIVCGRYDGALGLKEVEDGPADAVASGQLYNANPDIVESFRQGAPLNEPFQDTFYTVGPTGYIDYPALASSILEARGGVVSVN